MLFLSFKTILQTIILILFSTILFAHSGATGIIKERMEYFTQNKKNLKAIKSHINKGDLAAIVPLASQIKDWAKKMPDYFPSGSDEKPSEADPKIWTDFDGFKSAALENQVAANLLRLAAENGDIDEVIRAFESTATTCKSCHKSYRLD